MSSRHKLLESMLTTHKVQIGRVQQSLDPPEVWVKPNTPAPLPKKPADPIDAMINDLASRRANIVAKADVDIDAADNEATARAAAAVEKRGGFPVTGPVVEPAVEEAAKIRRRVRRQRREAAQNEDD